MDKNVWFFHAIVFNQTKIIEEYSWSNNSTGSSQICTKIKSTCLRMEILQCVNQVKMKENHYYFEKKTDNSSIRKSIICLASGYTGWGLSMDKPLHLVQSLAVLRPLYYITTAVITPCVCYTVMV